MVGVDPLTLGEEGLDRVAERRMGTGQKPRLRLAVNTWLWPVLTGVLLVLQLAIPYRGFTVLFVGLAGALLLGFLWTWLLMLGLRFSREVRLCWAHVGDELEERFTFLNRGLLPALWMEVTDHSTIPSYPSGWVARLGSRISRTWLLHAVCTRRGLFTLGPTTLRVGDPLGMFTVSAHYASSMPFLVVPPVLPLPSIQVAPGGQASGGRSRLGAGHTVSASSIREYQRGDSVRWIHWPTSARRDDLYVRLFDGAPTGDWWVLLDADRRVQAGEGDDSTLEHGVVLAASLADRGLRLGRAVGFVAHGEELVWMPPKEGDAHQWEILQTLALVSLGDCTLSTLLKQVGPNLGRRVSLILVTSSVDSAWVEALVLLRMLGVVPTVLLLDPVSFGGAGDVGEVVTMLTNLGVSHYVITPDLLDRAELVSDQRWEFRVSETGRAVLVPRSHDLSWRSVV